MRVYQVGLLIAAPNDSNDVLPSLLGRNVINNWRIEYAPRRVGSNAPFVGRISQWEHVSQAHFGAATAKSYCRGLCTGSALHPIWTLMVSIGPARLAGEISWKNSNTHDRIT